MSDRINILQRTEDLDKAPQFSAYSKVVIYVDDETDITVGDDLGKTLEITNPYGTEEMARHMLAKLRGFQYQPYTATGALLDPAAEMGDAIAVKDLYGGLYNRERVFDSLMKANISAPYEEEINSEYKFESPQERKVTRRFENVRKTLEFQVDSIDAKVSKEGSNSGKTFAWSLDADGFYIHNGEITRDVKENKTALFTFTNEGLSVKGNITATTGYIGNGSNGFTISASAIYNGMTSLSDTKHNGIYIGKNGIALGKGAFKVTSTGAITAKNIELSGTLTIAGKSITAANLELGARESANNHSNWTGATNTVNSNGSTWSTGARYGYNFDSMKNGGSNAYPINASSFRYNGTQYVPKTMSFVDGRGNTRTIDYLGIASE